ncbi:MAG: hypothetical protein WD844_16250 [Thermoleophilaceae bacterium]
MSVEAPPLRMTVDGIEAVLPRLTVTLPDGRTGYYQRSNGREDGCIVAAVATITQVPIEDVPPMDDFGEALEFFTAQGFRWESLHELPPPASDRRLWLGWDRRIGGLVREGQRDGTILKRGQTLRRPGDDLPDGVDHRIPVHEAMGVGASTDNAVADSYAMADAPDEGGWDRPHRPGELVHCIVGQGPYEYFDPASGWVFPGGHRSPQIAVEHAIAVERRD